MNKDKPTNKVSDRLEVREDGASYDAGKPPRALDYSVHSVFDPLDVEPMGWCERF